MRVLWDATDVYRSLYYADGSHRDVVHDEHRQVIDAVRVGDADRAVELLRRHRERAVVTLDESCLAGQALKPRGLLLARRRSGEA